MLASRSLRPTGALSTTVLRGNPFAGHLPWGIINLWRYAFPHTGLSAEVNWWRVRNLPRVALGALRIAFASLFGVPLFASALFVRVRRGGDWAWKEYGIASFRVVTTAGVNYLAGTFDPATTTAPTIFKFHGYGTGGGAEAIGNTALTTELTTEYAGATSGLRPTGNQAHGATPATYTTVATLTPDTGSPSVTEHGLFSTDGVTGGGGTLWDRSLFAAVGLASANGDSLQTTYVLTLTAGG